MESKGKGKVVSLIEPPLFHGLQLKYMLALESQCLSELKLEKIIHVTPNYID